MTFIIPMIIIRFLRRILGLRLSFILSQRPFVHRAFFAFLHDSWCYQFSKKGILTGTEIKGRCLILHWLLLSHSCYYLCLVGDSKKEVLSKLTRAENILAMSGMKGRILEGKELKDFIRYGNNESFDERKLVEKEMSTLLENHRAALDSIQIPSKYSNV